MTVGSASGGASSKGFALLQRLGRSLMLPIAVLPAAALLQRLGQEDLLGSVSGLQTVAGVIGAAGGALFDNLPLLFAIGVAIGFARKADGTTALSAAVGYLVLAGVMWEITGQEAGTSFNKGPYGVLGGIIAGLVAAWLWQRYHRIKLPDYLGFFGGRRFVPIVTAVAMLVIGTVLGLLFPLFDAGLTAFSDVVTANAVLGGGIYGLINRLLLPFGLHHIPNNVVWFLFGDYHGQKGDIARFFEGDPTAGTFQTGFFPIFMFALPAAALAIWRSAPPAQRKVVGGVMLSVGLTSFLTGITEPLEFSFIFVAWPLLLIHAVLTGTSHMLVNYLDIHSGFGFSAGAIDYVLNFGISQRSLWLIPIGLLYAVIYYFVFRFVITKWNLRTPGREDAGEGSALLDEGQSSGDAKPAKADPAASAESQENFSSTTATMSTDTPAEGGADPKPADGEGTGKS
ncbi:MULTISPECIES: PTS transporter subunit EIIC [unclassified Saccharopolyspora]|uniref:PTS transporter subunit EIIC n=1 Tax=unclassified Saccharopolyspora TaxID=2646250 RepID=UPI001CD50A58|nr:MULTISPECIES: PTS transporter subunit EIIC [unclassified Saccharopolyspora]MCA1190214.1 PTS transporter subunit EIIC [Saccharopolyspora sp. 6T]MCA1195215.1 PTS transporter subunit EIIC [Saccharopolyspora sp. 6V]MCA1225687.1 PTS transporter subunit EIIC [Saccharopolyspora sp. 6M]MCA1281222.1 PTS transporter subunit EIIC [Saccharopolyspora sp. 7B]